MVKGLGLYALAALVAGPLSATPPPPPPPYLSEVATLLISNGGSAPQARISDFVADDVKVYVNDRLVAQGKGDWLHYASAWPASAGLLGYSEGLAADGGSLMIVDQFDTINRSKLPKDFIVDSRFDARATLYEFGKDQKIHAIRALIGTGFWIKP
jgi:hypothetical protein